MHCCLAVDGLMLATGSDWLAMVGNLGKQMDQSSEKQLDSCRVALKRTWRNISGPEIHDVPAANAG